MRGHISEIQTQFAVGMIARLKLGLPIRHQSFRLRANRVVIHRGRFVDDCFNCSAHMFLFVCVREYRASHGILKKTMFLASA